MPGQEKPPKPLRVVFMGTPSFAIPSLEALIKAGHEVVAVVTQPDKPRGRGMEKGASPVKAAALKHKIPVLEPVRLKDAEFIERLKALRSDLIVVVAYGKILPEEVLKIPPAGCINVHASLLPKYRGAGPINRAIIDGEKETGVSIMLLDKGMDTGPVFAKERILIEDTDTAGSLSEKLSTLGVGLLVRTIGPIAEGDIQPERQDERLASYAPLLKKEDGHIDWKKTSREIKDLVRGLSPWPGTYTHWHATLLKIHSGRVGGEGIEGGGGGGPGTVIKAEDDAIAVRCGEGVFEIIEVQPENKKRMTAAEFMRGYRVKAGDTFA